jgi:hypothetical protein
MSEEVFQMLVRAFERQRRECDTPEKARALLQSEGLLDADGRTAAKYRAPEDPSWR